MAGDVIEVDFQPAGGENLPGGLQDALAVELGVTAQRTLVRGCGQRRPGFHVTSLSLSGVVGSTSCYGDQHNWSLLLQLSRGEPTMTLASAVLAPRQTEAPQTEAPRSAGRRGLRAVGLIAAVAVAVVVLRGQVPGLGAMWAALRQADPGWLILAAAAQVLSIEMFARQQTSLLRGFGVPMSNARSLAITYASTAVSVTMPAGGVVAAGFTIQQWRGRGGHLHDRRHRDRTVRGRLLRWARAALPRRFGRCPGHPPRGAANRSGAGADRRGGSWRWRRP